MFYLLIAAGWVVLDQAVKAWVVGNIPLHDTLSFLPGLVRLTYVQNTGAAFSIFSSHTWMLAALSAVAAAALAVVLLKRLFPHPVAMLSLALLLGGAVGNLIDRALLGYVVDMFDFQFMHFAVFNVADIGVTVGAGLMIVYSLFFYPSKEKRKEAGDAPSSDR